MEWLILGLFGAGMAVAAWFWGKASDPKAGGAVGCCHCGQCISSGECVLRKNMKKNAGKEKSAS